MRALVIITGAWSSSTDASRLLNDPSLVETRIIHVI